MIFLGEAATTSSSSTSATLAFDDINAARLHKTSLTPSRPPKMPRLASGPASKTPTKRETLGFCFNRCRKTIIDKYEEYKPEVALIFKNVCCFFFLNDF